MQSSEPKQILFREANLKQVRKNINIKRATEMEGAFGKHKKGAFGKHKNHYGLNRVKTLTKKTELLWIFFGIRTGNTVEIGKRIKKAVESSQRA